MLLSDIKKGFRDKINDALIGARVRTADFEYPDRADFGDLSLPCFRLAKELGKSPADIAKKLSDALTGVEYVVETKVVGPYLNIYLDGQKLGEEVLEEIVEDDLEYGWNGVGEGKRLMLEFSNGNTHKETHIGHLRNIAYGDAMVRIFRANGYEVVPVSYINDFGIHVAKTLWAYLKYHKDAALPENKGAFLGAVYVQGSNESKENEDVKREVGEMMKKIEARRGDEYELWQETRQWTIDQLAGIYKELGVRFSHIFYESEYIDEGLKRVDELFEKGVLKKSEGAIIADLESDDLGILVMKRADGTALYPVADIALAIEKFEKYQLDKSFYIVDNRQSLYFKQLFALLHKLGFKQEMAHLKYDFVDLPSGAMSSRTGNVVTYEQLKEEVFARIRKETKARHEDWSDEKIEEVTLVLGFGAMKFEMLKVGQDQVITFDMDKATATSGFTAAYLQYAYARMKSIIRKSQVILSNVHFAPQLAGQEEKQVTLKMAKYGEAIARSGEKYDPSEIAKYLFEFAQVLNDYYHTTPILTAEDEIKISRLMLIDRASSLLKNGLEMLGVRTVEEM